MRAIVAAAIAVTVSGGIAAAQNRPSIAPTKDVTVEYSYKATPRNGAPAQQGQSKIATTAGGKQIRVEGFGPAGYMIIDRAGGHTRARAPTPLPARSAPCGTCRATRGTARCASPMTACCCVANRAGRTGRW